LTGESLIIPALVPDCVPVIPATDGAGQLYVVPAGTTPFVPLTGFTVNEFPLHIVAVIFVILGLGLTVTVIVFVDVQ